MCNKTTKKNDFQTNTKYKIIEANFLTNSTVAPSIEHIPQSVSSLPFGGTWGLSVVLSSSCISSDGRNPSTMRMLFGVCAALDMSPFELDIDAGIHGDFYFKISFQVRLENACL